MGQRTGGTSEPEPIPHTNSSLLSTDAFTCLSTSSARTSSSVREGATAPTISYTSDTARASTVPACSSSVTIPVVRRSIARTKSAQAASGNRCSSPERIGIGHPCRRQRGAASRRRNRSGVASPPRPSGPTRRPAARRRLPSFTRSRVRAFCSPSYRMRVTGGPRRRLQEVVCSPAIRPRARGRLPPRPRFFRLGQRKPVLRRTIRNVQSQRAS